MGGRKTVGQDPIVVPMSRLTIFVGLKDKRKGMNVYPTYFTHLNIHVNSVSLKQIIIRYKFLKCRLFCRQLCTPDTHAFLFRIYRRRPLDIPAGRPILAGDLGLPTG